jgi:hypothetical protein
MPYTVPCPLFYTLYWRQSKIQEQIEENNTHQTHNISNKTLQAPFRTKGIDTQPVTKVDVFITLEYVW